MRSEKENKLVLDLWSKGFKKNQIAKETGIPRGTCRDIIERNGIYKERGSLKKF